MTERRSKVRFPLGFQVRYRILGEESPLWVEGRALNMSSGGMLIGRTHDLGVGEVVEVRIDWPLRLEGRIGLQLVAVGKVVRCGLADFAVLFSQHQFRTAGIRIRPDDARGPGFGVEQPVLI